MRIEHVLPHDLLRNRSVRVQIIGAGGTGSAVVLGLPYLDQAMRAWAHRHGLEVGLMDGDLVSETNCTATVSVSDIGQNKATVLVNRINLFWGTRWTAIPSHFHARSFDRHQDRCPDLVIGCVDTGARKAIVDAFAPLTVTGTAEELDRDLPATVVNFVSAHLELKNTLDRARAEMDTAAQAEARSKSKTQPTKVAAKPEPKASESANPIPQTPSESPRVASLFDSPEPAPRPGLDEEKEIPAEHQGEFREEVDEDEAA